MPPSDFAKPFFDFWKAQTEAFAQAIAPGTFPTPFSTPFSPGSADLAQASQAMMELWTAAGALSTALLAKLPSARGSETVEATFRHMLDPRSWLAGGGEMDEVLSRMSEGPRFADLWNMERRYARVMHAWAEMRRRSLEHQAVVLQAWMRAGGTFTKALGERGGADQPAPDQRALLAMWTEIANAELVETQRSEPFLAAQTAMIRASTELRLAQQELVEHAGKQYGFPTRTELDDVHRSVTELRREVRALRHAARTPGAAKPEAAKPEPGKAPASPPRRRAARANGGIRHDADRH
jgi:class III poly(R)-hydroxyalkanoic acid synthase PhaE subunit